MCDYSHGFFDVDDDDPLTGFQSNPYKVALLPTGLYTVSYSRVPRPGKPQQTPGEAYFLSFSTTSPVEGGSRGSASNISRALGIL